MTTVTLGVPNSAVSEHVPDNLAQALDPNYVACMMAVEDASPDFRDVLQYTCIEHSFTICSGVDGEAPSSQIVRCIHFETQRGVSFLAAGVADLPDTFEEKGWFGRLYEKRRVRLLNDIDTLKNLPKPQSIEIATEQGSTTAATVLRLLYLARETEIPLEAHVLTTSGDH